jgi:hypothetical protein
VRRSWAARSGALALTVLAATIAAGAVDALRATAPLGMPAPPAPSTSSLAEPAPPVREPRAAPPSQDAGGDARVPAPARAPLPRGEPANVVIPAIGVDASLVRLGLRRDRAMEVPAFGLAGWYAEGPMPGHPGPSVVAAHVDSRSGPDVFADLGRLAAGDHVHVDYDSGDRVTFVVTRSERTAKTALPTASIWPLTNARLLTLITCGGAFDRSTGHYLDNLIVFTVPLEEIALGGSVTPGRSSTG